MSEDFPELKIREMESNFKFLVISLNPKSIVSLFPFGDIKNRPLSGNSVCMKSKNGG